MARSTLIRIWRCAYFLSFAHPRVLSLLVSSWAYKWQHHLGDAPESRCFAKDEYQKGDSRVRIHIFSCHEHAPPKWNLAKQPLSQGYKVGCFSHYVFFYHCSKTSAGLLGKGYLHCTQL